MVEQLEFEAKPKLMVQLVLQEPEQELVKPIESQELMVEQIMQVKR
jgi:hypothetical protein